MSEGFTKDPLSKEGSIKRIIALAIVLATMLISIGEYLVKVYEGGERGR